LVKIRDPIHGFIEVSDQEMKIIDSAPFQRLRNIRQLATSYLVYPGAEHTRFAHSIGVMHLVSKAFDAAVGNFKLMNDGGELFNNKIDTKWYRQILRLIALTHDLGHAPFSHAFEEIFAIDPKDTKGKRKIKHEYFTMKIICETEIADYIKQISDEFILDNIENIGNNTEEYKITPELLWLIYEQENPEEDSRYKPRDFKLLRGFMNSELDCDKMDYLLRDSYYCGVNYGRYDVDRLISSLTVYNNEKYNVYQLAIKQSGIHVFEEFVIARYFMFIQVYFHKTRRYLDYLLVKAVKSLDIGEIGHDFSVNTYMQYDDNNIIDMLKAEARSGNKSAIAFKNRDLKSCVYQTSTHSNSTKETQWLNKIYDDLKKNLGNNAVWIDKAVKEPHKMPAIGRYDDPDGKGIPVIVSHSDTATNVIEESVLLQGLHSLISISRIYVDRNQKEKAKKIVKSYFPNPNESYEEDVL